jgi:hypothetical protein
MASLPGTVTSKGSRAMVPALCGVKRYSTLVHLSSVAPESDAFPLIILISVLTLSKVNMEGKRGGLTLTSERTGWFTRMLIVHWLLTAGFAGVVSILISRGDSSP